MAEAATDLEQLIRRREVMAYEQRLARKAYAYGVDLRRSAWLDHSTIGEPLMRTVDRRWNGLIDDLNSECLAPPRNAAPTEVMEEILRILRMLRAPLPTVRLLRKKPQPLKWPMVTALGTTNGGTHWLVLDVERLMALSPGARSFWLGSGLGNLQCDHGPMFAAHLMAHRAEKGGRFVRTLLRPWSKVAVFSADRAGLLAAPDIETSLSAVKTQSGAEVDWMPDPPATQLRTRSLEEFDKSQIMTRLRLLSSSGTWSITPPASSKKPEESGEVEPDAEKTKSQPEIQLSPQAEEQLKKAWSLARCDGRLTRRLGLL